jgi:hypothetical protein
MAMAWLIPGLPTTRVSRKSRQLAQPAGSTFSPALGIGPRPTLTGPPSAAMVLA